MSRNRTFPIFHALSRNRNTNAFEKFHALKKCTEPNYAHRIKNGVDTLTYYILQTFLIILTDLSIGISS